MFKVFYTNKNDQMKSKVITSNADLSKILKNSNNCIQHYTDLNNNRLSFETVFKILNGAA